MSRPLLDFVVCLLAIILPYLVPELLRTISYTLYYRLWNSYEAVVELPMIAVVLLWSFVPGGSRHLVLNFITFLTFMSTWIRLDRGFGCSMADPSTIYMIWFLIALIRYMLWHLPRWLTNRGISAIEHFSPDLFEDMIPANGATQSVVTSATLAQTDSSAPSSAAASSAQDEGDTGETDLADDSPSEATIASPQRPPRSARNKASSSNPKARRDRDAAALSSSTNSLRASPWVMLPVPVIPIETEEVKDAATSEDDPAETESADEAAETPSSESHRLLSLSSTGSAPDKPPSMPKNLSSTRTRSHPPSTQIPRPAPPPAHQPPPDPSPAPARASSSRRQGRQTVASQTPATLPAPTQPAPSQAELRKCAGTTKAGHRCKKDTKAPQTDQWYCHLHKRKL